MKHKGSEYVRTVYSLTIYVMPLQSTCYGVHILEARGMIINGASGYYEDTTDGIHSRVVVETQEQLVRPLTIIFNKSLSEGSSGTGFMERGRGGTNFQETETR